MRVSLIGKESRDAERMDGTKRRFASMGRALEKRGTRVETAFLSKRDEFVEALDRSRPDMVFCFAHAFDDDGPGPHAVLESLGLAYVGSRQPDIDAALSKPAMKRRWTEAGIRTPEWTTVVPGGTGADSGPGDGAWIVKPARGGNSEGIDASSIVRSWEAASAKAQAMARRYGEAIVERYLGDSPDFREFTATLIGDPSGGPGDWSVMPVEIRLSRGTGPRIVMGSDKAGSGTRAEPVAEGAFLDSLRGFASDCFSVAGLRDYGRCDIVLSGGEFYALEANGQPMMPDPWFDACAAAAGMNSEEAVLAVFDSAIARSKLGLGRSGGAGRTR